MSWQCHGINKKNVSCFSKNQSIVLQPAVSGLEMFLSPPTSCDLSSLTFMNPGCYNCSYPPGYQTPGPPGSHADHHAFDQCPYYPTYQTMPSDPTDMLPTSQYTAVWDIQGSLRQTPATPSMIPFVGPTSSHISEAGSLLASTQPIGFHLAQSQVGLFTASIMKAIM